MENKDFVRLVPRTLMPFFFFLGLIIPFVWFRGFPLIIMLIWILLGGISGLAIGAVFSYLILRPYIEEGQVLILEEK